MGVEFLVESLVMFLDGLGGAAEERGDFFGG